MQYFDETHPANGGGWIKYEHFNDDNCIIYNPLRDYIEALKNLPYVIVLNKEKTTRINIVHAELRVEGYGPCTDEEIDTDFEDLYQYFYRNNFSKEEIDKNLRDSFNWGNSLTTGGLLDEQSAGLSMTFSGHTTLDRVVGYNHARPYRFSHVMIDSGACYQREGDGLTLVNLSSGERYFAGSHENASQSLVVDRLDLFS